MEGLWPVSLVSELPYVVGFSIIFMEAVRCGELRILSLLSADDVALLELQNRDIRFTLVEFEAVGNSVIGPPSQKREDCPLRARAAASSGGAQVGEEEQEIEGQIGANQQRCRRMNRSVRELSRKAKHLIDQLIINFG